MAAKVANEARSISASVRSPAWHSRQYFCTSGRIAAGNSWPAPILRFAARIGAESGASNSTAKRTARFAGAGKAAKFIGVLRGRVRKSRGRQGGKKPAGRAIPRGDSRGERAAAKPFRAEAILSRPAAVCDQLESTFSDRAKVGTIPILPLHPISADCDHDQTKASGEPFREARPTQSVLRPRRSRRRTAFAGLGLRNRRPLRSRRPPCRRSAPASR